MKSILITFALAMAMSAPAFAETVQDVNKTVVNRVPYQVEVCTNQTVSGDKTGDALKIIPKLEAYWDLVFIDADKENYLTYYEMVLPKLKPRGFIIVDNVLWDGKVIDENEIDKKTKSLKLFNNFVHQDARVDNLLLPIRDGLMILRKK